MTKDKKGIAANSELEKEDPPLTREGVLRLLSKTILRIEKKFETGRVRDRAQERTRLDIGRLLCHACSVYLGGLKDAQLDQLAARIDELEARIEGKNAEKYPIIKKEA